MTEEARTWGVADVRKECRGCVHLGWANGYRCYDYILHELHSRPCPAGQCREAGVYKSRKKRGRKPKDGAKAEGY